MFGNCSEDIPDVNYWYSLDMYIVNQWHVALSNPLCCAPEMLETVALRICVNETKFASAALELDNPPGHVVQIAICALCTAEHEPQTSLCFNGDKNGNRQASFFGGSGKG
jgi:hypothetical protein